MTPKYRNCPECGAVMDGLLKCPKCGYMDVKSRWTEKEDERLIQFWNEKLTPNEIAAKLLNRNEGAVKNRVARLKKKGKIKGRWTKKGFEPKTPTPSTPSTPSTLTSTPIMNTSLTVQLNVNCNDAKAVANFLKIIEKLGETLKCKV